MSRVHIEDLVVRETSWSGHGLGKRIRQSADHRSPADNGSGTDLFSPAYDEVKDRVDLDAYEPGTRVATLTVDLDAWSYELEYHVPANADDPSLVERLRRWWRR